MTDNDKPRRGRLSKLAKRLLWALIPISVLVGFAIWVHGKTVFTPDFLEKHGFKLRVGVDDSRFRTYVYESAVPVAQVVADLKEEMTNRGFDVEDIPHEDFSEIRITNWGMDVGFLVGDDQGVHFFQYQFLSIPDRIRLATGWRLNL